MDRKWAASQLTIKWVGLAAAIWVQAFAGNAYTFPNFSSRLKSVLDYSQLQLNSLGVAKDFGENVGLITGYLSNKLPAWAILLVGGLEAFVGYGVLWLVVSERIYLPYPLMCVAICVGANSATFFNTAVLVTMMRNFPQSRGTVVGILKGFVGLSGAIFTQIFTSFLGKDPVSLLLLLSLSPLAVSLLAMYFVRPVPAPSSRDPEEKRNFLLVHAICIAIAVYILVVTLAQDFIPIRSQLFKSVATSIMLLFLLAPIFVALKFFILSLFSSSDDGQSAADSAPLLIEDAGPRFRVGSHEELPHSDEECTPPSYPHTEDAEQQQGAAAAAAAAGEAEEEEDKGCSSSMSESASAASLSEAELENDAEMLMAVGEGAVVVRRRRPRRGEDFNLRQALLKADFWLLFFTFFCGVGSGVTAINNFGQMGQAQGYADATVFIILIGIWNFLGRLAGGAISEKYVRRGVPRTVWLAGAQALMVVAHLFFAWGGTGSLHAGSTILGVCYGVHFSVMVPTASELFGLKHFGKIYNFLTMGDPVGSFLFSGIIAGSLYDREARQDAATGDSYCYGPHCFRLTFLLMAMVCIVGMLASAYVSVRIKPVYRSLYLKGHERKAGATSSHNSNR